MGLFNRAGNIQNDFAIPQGKLKRFENSDILIGFGRIERWSDGLLE